MIGEPVGVTTVTNLDTMAEQVYSKYGGLTRTMRKHCSPIPMSARYVNGYNRKTMNS